MTEENETPTMNEDEEPQGNEEQETELEEQELGKKVSTSPGRGVLKAGLFFAVGALLAGAAVSAMPYLNVLRYSGTEVSDTLYACKVSQNHYLRFFFDFGSHGKLMRDTYTVRLAAEREEEPWERLESQTLRFRYAKEIGYDSPDIVVLKDNGSDGTVDEVRSYTLTWDLSDGDEGPDWFSAPAVTREELDEETAALLDTILADYRGSMDIEKHCD